MKKFFLILVLISSFCSLSGQPKILYGCEFKDSALYNRVLLLIAKDLQLETTNTTIILSPGILNESLSGMGCIVQTAPEEFIINIKGGLYRDEKICVLIHECVHIQQIYQKRLQIRKASAFFEGVLYTAKSPYEERKYEIEAMNVTKMLFSKCKSYLKKPLN